MTPYSQPQQTYYEAPRRRKPAKQKPKAWSITGMIHDNKRYLALVVIVFLCIMFGVPKLATTIPNVVVAPTGQLNAFGIALVATAASLTYAITDQYM